MAEHSFREVMHEVNRLCMAIRNCDQNCPLNNMGCCGNLGTHCSDPLQVERIEDTVMSWAAEHPEPVYPRWIDWLADVGLIINTANYYTFNFTAAVDQIPADIAEKLGIEPIK